MQKAYEQQEGKVVDAGGRFEHVMALTLNPLSHDTDGVIRCITSREGDVKVKGYIDRSKLYRVTGESLERFSVGEELIIKNKEEVIARLTQPGWDFIGLEDPDLWLDTETALLHMYFTIPIRPDTDDEKIKIHLGHAVGKDLYSLEMTTPSLINRKQDDTAKEVSVAPKNSRGSRYNLVESRDRQAYTTYSTVRVAIAEDMGKPWIFGETVFHPAEHNISWIGGHASPGPLLPKTFIDVGEHKLLGIINGREANKEVEGKTVYGMFSVGLFIYNYEQGKIEWVSPEPFIQDMAAKTITFASEFIETAPGAGILYAHVDDSFVRAYSLCAEGIKSLLP